MSSKSYLRSSIAFLLSAAAVQAIAQQAPKDDSNLETIVVTGVRAAEEKAVELKRGADAIQDSIAAEDIGKLPDTTIADSLQRITGVQIDRVGGEGTSVNIRGLPQVGTLLNGESFLTTSSIVSVQPNFGDIPSQLFAGADVHKSSMASLLNAGITGTIDLRTRRPFELKDGWTLSGATQGTHGSQSGKFQPEVDGLVGYRASRWGVLASGAYSDLTLENSTDGMDQYGAEIIGESANTSLLDDGTYGLPAEGFLNSFLGAPLPKQYTLLHPANCTQSGGAYFAATSNGCDVDVNGDGKAGSAFLGSANFTALSRQLERKRTGFNLSAQADLGGGIGLVGDVFYTKEKSFNRTTGYQLNGATFMGGSFVPLVARNTGVVVGDGFNGDDAARNTFHTTQRYQYYPGDIETYAENQTEDTRSRNVNVELHYSNGGNFSAELRGIYADAKQLHMQSYAQFAVSDGNLWPNEPIDAAPPGQMVYPGGNRVFDPFGFAANTIPAVVDMSGNHLSIALPSALLATLTNPNAYSLKTITSENNFDRDSLMHVARADGHYSLGSIGLQLNFGGRYETRTASNTNFELVAPVYGRNGAYNNAVDADGNETDVVTPNATGCYVRYKAADILLDGGGIAGACKAGDPTTGFYRAGSLSAQSPSKLPPILANNFSFYNQLASVNGVGIFDLNPKVMDDVLAFQNALYPGEIRNVDPGGTWRVRIEQTTGYLQGNYKGTLGRPVSANLGVKFIDTKLGIDQHKVDPGAIAYYLAPGDLGVTHTDRSFTDVLPALNVAIDMRDDLKLRFAYAKNMQLLDLDQWGGGLTLNYGIVAGTSPPISAVLGGSQNGNPDLNPWRSSNYDLSLEYYFGRSNILSIAVFYVDVASFIDNGNIVRCDLPDQDGVVRNRCVAINGPIQGEGKSLHGVEVGFKQAFDFLPGLLSHTGVDASFTYSPSDSGKKDVAGNTIPFQNNSQEQGNLILWFQDRAFQARIAGNFRSKRAVSGDFAGLSGFEEYQAPTYYLDASASYDITSHLQVFVQGSNLTGEIEQYYLAWPDQKLHTNRFESRYVLGVRGRL